MYATVRAALACLLLSVLAGSLPAAQVLRYQPIDFSALSPVTINLPATYGSSTYVVDLLSGGVKQDAIIKFPSAAVTYRVIVKNGRKVNVIGGAITYSGPDSPALSFVYMDVGSVVFIEGMVIDVSNSHLTGDVNAPSTDAINAHGDMEGYPDVYIQNTKIIGVKGVSDGHHGDGFQFTGGFTDHPINGRGRLYMGYCDIETSYQGAIVAKQAYHDPYYTLNNDFEHCYFKYNLLSPYNPSSSGYDDGSYQVYNTMAYIYWSTAAGSDAIPSGYSYPYQFSKVNSISVRNVWMQPGYRGQTIKNDALKPNVVNVSDAAYDANNSTGTITLGHPHAYGFVNVGTPSATSATAAGSQTLSAKPPGAGYTYDPATEGTRTDTTNPTPVIIPLVAANATSVSGSGTPGAAFNDAPTTVADLSSPYTPPNDSSWGMNFANSVYAIDFGAEWYKWRITELWSRYRVGTSGQQHGFAYAHWDTVARAAPTTGLTAGTFGTAARAYRFNFGTANVTLDNTYQRWVKDASFVNEPVAPKARYLILTTDGTAPTYRVAEIAVVGFKVFDN